MSVDTSRLVQRVLLSDGTTDVAVDTIGSLQVKQNPTTTYTRILLQSSVATGQTYTSNVVASQMASGKNGYHLMIQQTGTGTAELRVNVYGSVDGTTKITHEIERFFVLCPQGGSAFPGFVTGFCPFPYLIVEVYTDAVIPGGSPVIAVDWLPFSGANMIPNTGDTYGQNANIQGTARLRVRGSYNITSGLLGAGATSANEGVMSLFNPAGSGVRTVIKSIEITGVHAAAAAASPPLDFKAIYLQTLSADPTAITAVTLATQRANDTVSLVPLTILRVEDGGDTCALDATFTRPLKAWIMPTAPSNFYYVWRPRSEAEQIVLRPGQGVAFITPVAFDANEFYYSINITADEQA